MGSYTFFERTINTCGSFPKRKTPPRDAEALNGECVARQSAAIATATGASGLTLTLVRRLSFGENSTTPSISEKIV